MINLLVHECLFNTLINSASPYSIPPDSKFNPVKSDHATEVFLQLLGAHDPIEYDIFQSQPPDDMSRHPAITVLNIV